MRPPCTSIVANAEAEVEVGIHYGCEPSYSMLREHPHDQTDPNRRHADALELCEVGVTKLIVQHSTQPLGALLDIVRFQAGDSASATHSGCQFVEIAAALGRTRHRRGQRTRTCSPQPSK